MKWMNLPDEYSGEDSSFIVLPIAYEKNVTYGAGASRGAIEVVKASKHLEYYDEELDCEFFEKGVYIHPLLKLSSESAEDMVALVQEKLKPIEANKFIIGLGGDHAVTIGLVKGLEEFYGDFAILQIDAHSDFRDSWNGSKLNHACVIRQLVDKHEVVAVGIRAQDKDENEAVENCENLQTIYGWEFDIKKVREALLNIKAEKLYITIDVDGFDPSVISCTGTPEPGGLLWQQVIEILKLCFSLKKVIGCDVVEFAPEYVLVENNERKLSSRARSEAYILARLVSKVMAMKGNFFLEN